MMKARQTSPEVFYATDRVPRVARADVIDLTREAARTERRRARLCTHRDVSDAVHEMFIVHPRGAYVRPHRHVNKAESMSVLEGDVDLVLFDEGGGVTEVIGMGDIASGRPFYYRMLDSTFHTLLIRSEWLIFHEVTSGPFVPEDTVFAPWAPPDAETAAVAAFLDRLDAQAAAFVAAAKQQ